MVTITLDTVIPADQLAYALRWANIVNPFSRFGITRQRPDLLSLISKGGVGVAMPYWQPLGGERQIIVEGQPLTVGRITAGQDYAVVHNDAGVWGYNAMVPLATGEDPGTAIAQHAGDFWANADRSMALATLRGVMAAPSMADHRLHVAAESIATQTASSVVSRELFIDATALLGSKSRELTHVVVHSAVEAVLRKQNEVSTIPASDGKGFIDVYQGRMLHVDDGCPMRDGLTDGKVTSMYLLGEGAFSAASQDLTGEAPESAGAQGCFGLEWQRNGLAGETVIIYRRRHVFHPNGVRWLRRPEDGSDSPNDIALADGANWLRVWPTTDIRMVEIECNLPAR